MKYPIIPSFRLAVLAGFALISPAMATLVNYSITGSDNDNWTGQFEVTSLYGAANTMDGNTLSMSANTWDPIVCATVGTPMDGSFSAFGVETDSLGYVYWNEFQFVWMPMSMGTYGLELNSIGLYTALNADATWNDLIGQSYDIKTLEGDGVVSFHDPLGTLTGTGGQISFSLNAVPEVTSSFTLLGLIASGLMLRRRSKHLRCLPEYSLN